VSDERRLTLTTDLAIQVGSVLVMSADAERRAVIEFLRKKAASEQSLERLEMLADVVCWLDKGEHLKDEPRARP
jgi:hypothetical protein